MRTKNKTVEQKKNRNRQKSEKSVRLMLVLGRCVNALIIHTRFYTYVVVDVGFSS